MTVLVQTTAVSSPEPCLSSRLVNVQGRVKLQAQATGIVSVSQHTAANRLPEPEPVSLWAYKFAQEMSFESTNFFHPQHPLATVNFSLTMYCVKKTSPFCLFLICQSLISLCVPQFSYWGKPGAVPTCLLLHATLL